MAPKIFGILTAITLAAAAFIANVNKTRYQAEIDETARQHEALDKSKVRLAVAEERMNITLPGEIAVVEGDLAKLKSEEEAQTKINEELAAQISDKTAKIATNKAKLDEFREKTAKVGDLKDLAAKMRTINAELKDLNASIESTKAKIDNLTAENTSTVAQITSTQGKFDTWAKGNSLPDLKTRIRSIYPNWGFVTLASGNNAGVMTNSNLNVVRDGQVIAKLLVTAVESGSATASIVPDSLAADTTLMVGDRVEAVTK